MKTLKGFVHKNLSSGMVTAFALLLVAVFSLVSCEMVPPVRSMVNDLDLTDKVTAPKPGTHPDYTPIDTEQYSGTLTWREENGIAGLNTAYEFQSDTVYKAYITLKAKNPWTFVDVVALNYDYATVENPTNLDIQESGWGADGDEANVIITFDKDFDSTAEENKK